MRVFVTGGAGFIGSTVSRVLLEEGHDVTVLDNLSKGFRELLHDGARFIEGDLRDEERLPEWLAGHDAVIHMAASIEVGRSVQEPLEFAENNILNTIRLLEGMRRAAVPKIVYSSSATVYGEPRSLPLRETDPPGVQSNPYGATKVSAEAFVAVYNQLYEMDALILRYFNPYGPNEMHDPETHAIPNFIMAALEKRPLPLYHQGQQVRDFIYVDDLARAHTALLSMKGLDYFNIGSDNGTKIIDVVHAIIDIIGYDVEVKNLGARPGDIEANFAWSQKLADATGWSPQVGLHEGLERTIEWFRGRPA